MKRFICSLAVIFALLPFTATADSLPPPEVSMPLKTFQPLKPLAAPVVAEVAPVEEIPVPAPEPTPVAPVQPTAPVYPTTGNCGDNMYKQYIYSHESGCDTNRYNSIGCYGIGQACPASKIAQCGTDFTCQDEWFTQYAYSAYGGWEQAYNFWLQHSWW